MKAAILFYSLSLPLTATAQKLVATAPPRTYQIGTEKAFLYRTPADTSDKKSSFFLYPGAETTVVGVFSPHWAIIKREGFLYLIKSKQLANYESDAIVSPGILSSMPIDPETKLITYQGVVEVPGISKADLYLRAHTWVAKAYQSANDVIQIQDKDAGQLLIKGVVKIGTSVTYDGVVRHTLTIYELC